jgi:histidine racemase
LHLNFVKVDPSGNTTIFILDPIPRRFHAQLAAQLIKPASLFAEQVGYVERAYSPDAIARLQMAGGEFCGNAARGFAAWLALGRFPGIVYRKDARAAEIDFEISGHSEILKADVQFIDPAAGRAFVELPMPLPERIEQKTAPDGQPFTLVLFEGIVHAVIWNSSAGEKHFNQIKQQVEQDLGPVEAVGVMYFNEQERLLTPIVYVRSVNSVVWENSCGSGAVAVTSALAEKYHRSIDYFSLQQPGGRFEVKADWKDRICGAAIRGEVKIRAEGRVYLSHA